ncbi:hypothetical protein U9K52_09860 [Chryseobacterium sp. MHB01]|uniref:hypothetical protein n=1 Tax=Chryseobacterium sp. MHB01 TaxID=3109433 RepID=UPI002AFFD2C3|nr:hypothetical protein [Chryseobacterium sp. MHB01]MEA1849217.1 hypothetical protein [Chryseobacterium sp. MHB01]
MITVKENEVYKRERKTDFTLVETITLKLPKPVIYEKQEYDWYMTVALEKIDKITKDRHLLTAELILGYRWAIREGFNHQLDTALKNTYDYPRNRNTVDGVKSYIKTIENKANNEYRTA